MTSELTTLLDHIGYAPRSQQVALYEHLITLDNTGVIAQAGTGVGKSIAILAAAAHLRQLHDVQSLVVTPTRVLMDQYMASDAPAAAECFGMEVAELRGKRWYSCARSAEFDPDAGCMASDANCTLQQWQENGYLCEYQEAKLRASAADIVVTNSDMLIVNDRLLQEPIFDREGPLLVDEAHQLEPKLRSWADRSVNADNLTRQGPAGRQLASWIAHFREPVVVADQPQLPSLIKGVLADFEEEVTLSVRQQQTKESLIKIESRLAAPTDKALIWTDGESLKLSWIDVSTTARELLRARPFGLVSATVPSSMAGSLGVEDARVIDVGHPFDYAKQASVGVSQVNGAFKYASHPNNIATRADEILTEVLAARGGALLLFSSFKDLERVYDQIAPALKSAGLTVLRQDGTVDNKLLGEQFKADGNAVLFGSESFATGFDAPGEALRLTVIFKLPYPGKDPVSEALMKRYYPRYKDQMLTRITQAAGRLIRTVDDQGRLFIADSRAAAVLQDNSLMCRHLREFKRQDVIA
jgi:Rad3-related DNA helicase